jgi:hypothetical protein
MRNVSDKSCREYQNTQFVFSKFFFENLAFYEIMWENIVERGRPQMAIKPMGIANQIPNITNKHSEYVILITLHRQQWLRKHPSMLGYTYIDIAIYAVNKHNIYW